MATMNDIANAVGVAKSTVSRALREDPTLSLSDETREKIFAAAQQMGYKVKKEKLLSGGMSIAVIHKDSHFLNQLDNAYYFSLRYGVEKICLTKGIQCVFIPYSFLKQLPAHLDGAVVMGNFEEAQVENIIAATRNIPLSFIGKINYAPQVMDWITYDVKSSVDIAMKYLEDSGFQKLLYVGGIDVPGTPVEYQVQFYFQKYLEEHPEMVCAEVLEGEHGTESGYRMMKSWLELNQPLPQAVFVSNDPIAFGVLRALAEKEISVPAEVSVISMNGDGPGESTAPPLTTVDIRTEAMGEESVRCLMERVNKERQLTKKVLYSPALICRNSVTPIGKRE